VVLAPDHVALTSLFAAVAASFTLAAATALFHRSAGIAPLFSVLGGVCAAVLGIGLVLGPGDVSLAAGRVLDFSPLTLHYDGLSGAFLVAVGLSTAAASLSIVGSGPRSRIEGSGYPLFLLSMVLVLGASDAFSFLLAWELMAVLSALLVVGTRPSGPDLAAGYLYLAMTHVATAAIVIGFAILAAGVGGDLAFAAWRAGSGDLAAGPRDLVFLLVVVGFGTKAGALPFHAWLPRAHPVAPSHVSAVMSGVMIKMGVYGLVRIALDVMGGGPDWWGLVLVVIGASSAVLGVLYALMQHDLKRLLAYHSIENIGIILLGLGSALVLKAHGLPDLAALALAAALFHSLNHAVFKTLLFLGAGAVVHVTGLRDLDRMGGLARIMPVTALTFGVGAAAISGLPPFNGFASEWLVFQGLLGTVASAAVPALARSVAAVTIGALALTAALAVACFVKVTGIAFLGRPRSDAASTGHETSGPARLAMGFLAGSCLALGLAAGPIVTALMSVSRTVLGEFASAPAGLAAVTALPRPAGSGATFAAFALGLLVCAAAIGTASVQRRRGVRVRQVDTWTCGIAPQPAFQYTAASYSKPIRLFFHRILLPEREIRVEYHPGTAFPVSIHYRSQITLLLEDRIFRPGHVLGLRAAKVARRLQGGAIQLYLAYTVIAVLILLLVAR